MYIYIYIYIYTHISSQTDTRSSPCTLWAPAVCHQEHPSRSSLWHQGHRGSTGSGGHPPSRSCYCETGRAPEEQNTKTSVQLGGPESCDAVSGVLLCSFTKSWCCFGGCTRTCAHVVWKPNLSQIIYILQSLSTQPDTNDSISSGFDEAPPSEKLNVLWLVSCPSALWLANSLDCVNALPLTKTASSSILRYQSRPG